MGKGAAVPHMVSSPWINRRDRSYAVAHMYRGAIFVLYSDLVNSEGPLVVGYCFASSRRYSPPSRTTRCQRRTGAPIPHALESKQKGDADRWSSRSGPDKRDYRNVGRGQRSSESHIPIRTMRKVDPGTDLRPSRSTLQDCIYFAQHRAPRHARCVAMQVWLLVPQRR